MNHPLLSIIVPVYNTAPWLRRCLDSICSQSYQNIEVLCINDGSTDNSAEILAEYTTKDTRIKVFTQENAGLSAARNTGLQHAKGEWVTGVDSDDYLYPDIYSHAISCCKDEIDMVFFGVQDIAEDGSLLPKNGYFNLPHAGEYPMSPELAKTLNVCFWSKLWRRSVIEDNNLRFPHGLVHEDEAMYYLALPYVRNVAMCPTVGYAYMKRDNSIMSEVGNDLLKRVNRQIPILEFTHAEYEKRNLLSSPAFAYLQIMFTRICFGYYWIKQEEHKDKIFSIIQKILLTCNMAKTDYSLERFLISQKKGCLTISYHPCAKIYKWGFIPIWIKWYTYSGREITFSVLCFHLKKFTTKILHNHRS